VQSVDPSGAIYENIPCERVIGCVVYPAAELVAPGVVKHVEGNRFPVGEPDGTTSERVSEVFAMLRQRRHAGADLERHSRGNLVEVVGQSDLHPISALSRATLASICQYPPSRAIAAAMMTEAQSVAHQLGVKFRVPLEKRIAGAEKVGHHKTSMLQDVEGARTLEIDALLGSVVNWPDGPTPRLRISIPCTR